jgi:ABC-2 type transport system permease protein
MASSAVLTGRTLSDVVYNGGILIVLMLSGVWLGLSVPTVEVAQQVGFTVLFPITFISNIFVPPGSLPSWLQPIADWNQSSTLTTSLRELWGNPTLPASSRFPSQELVLVTLGWIVVIIAIFGSLGVRRYRSMSR